MNQPEFWWGGECDSKDGLSLEDVLPTGQSDQRGIQPSSAKE